jgi:hypothetical protein
MKTLARIVLFPGSILAIVALSCLPSNAAPIFSFYTGDPNVLNSGVTNIINPTGVSGFNSGNPYFSNLYQSFVVPVGGWTVEEVFSNDAVDFSTAQAEWEIRSGMSNGNGGTVVASGTSAATQTSTGLVASNGLTIYTIAVNGLSIALTPGTYWLTVAPVGSPDSGIVGTNGANSVDAGGTSNIANFPAIGFNFLAGGTSGTATTFSMGLIAASEADAVPEPGTLTLTAAAVVFLLMLRAGRKVLN